MRISVEQLAALVHGTVEGDATAFIDNYSKIEEATPGCLTFLANPKYTHHIYTTQATAVLVRKDFVPEQEVKATLIRVDDPYETLAHLLNFVNSQQPAKQGIEQPCHLGSEVPEDAYVGAFAYIGENVTVGNNVKIYPQVYVGDNVTLGDDVILYPGVKIYHGCKIGKRCIIQAGAVIGSDGFGFAPKQDGTYEKISQVGIVILEDDVEIGANSAVDRAKLGSTLIGDHCKIDNLVHEKRLDNLSFCTILKGVKLEISCLGKHGGRLSHDTKSLDIKNRTSATVVKLLLQKKPSAGGT